MTDSPWTTVQWMDDLAHTDLSVSSGPGPHDALLLGDAATAPPAPLSLGEPAATLPLPPSRSPTTKTVSHPATRLAVTRHAATRHPTTRHPTTRLAATRLAEERLAATRLAAARHPATRLAATRLAAEQLAATTTSTAAKRTTGGGGAARASRRCLALQGFDVGNLASAEQTLLAIRRECRVAASGCWLWPEVATADAGRRPMNVYVAKHPRTARVLALECRRRSRIGPGTTVRCALGCPCCVNPDHASISMPRARGADHPQAKLTEDDVRAIRALPGPPTLAMLAARYGVSKCSARKILAGRSWQHVA